MSQTETTMRLRKEYLDGTCSHQEYYSQFVTPEITRLVQGRFGKDALTKAYAEDPHLNTIPLKRWDDLGYTELPRTGSKPTGGFRPNIAVSREKLIASGESGGTVTRAFLVCVLKSAARDIIGA